LANPRRQATTPVRPGQSQNRAAFGEKKRIPWFVERSRAGGAIGQSPQAYPAKTRPNRPPETANLADRLPARLLQHKKMSSGKKSHDTNSVSLTPVPRSAADRGKSGKENWGVIGAWVLGVPRPRLVSVLGRTGPDCPISGSRIGIAEWILGRFSLQGQPNHGNSIAIAGGAPGQPIVDPAFWPQFP